MYRTVIAAVACGWLLAAVVSCMRNSGPQGLAVQGESEALCVRYATQADADLKSRIAAKQDAPTMAAIDRRELSPGLPALVAYCVHGAPIERRKAAASEGEIEHVTFCRQPIESGQRCEAAGPTLVIAADRIAADRIAANPTPTGA